MTDFYDAVAARSDVEADDVQSVLKDAGVVLQPSGAAPRALQVTRIAFTGTKTLDGRPPQSFRVDRAVSAGLWAITSRQNLAGKSSVLHMIRWALTGRCKLRDDVRSWIDDVTVEGQIDGENFIVSFSDVDDQPTGRLTCGGRTIATFARDDAFEEVTGAFFSSRLGLDPTPWWQSRSGGIEGEGDARRIGWQGYFPALHIRSSAGPLLGEQTQGGQPGTLLQVFLGVPWSLTSATSHVALSTVRRDLSAACRRSRDDAAARRIKRRPLEDRLEKAERALERLRVAASPLPPHELDARVAAFQAACVAVTDAIAELQAVRAEHADAQAEADAAQRGLLAMKESVAVQPLLGRLEPTQCPRCVHALSDDRPAREADGHCFVCDRPIESGPVDEAAVASAISEADAATAAAKALELQVTRLQEMLAAATADRDRARALLEEAKRREPSAAAEQELLREIAVVGALLDQDERLKEDAANIADLERLEQILSASDKEAKARRKEAAATFRKRLGEEIVSLGRKFGIDNLTAADPNLGASLKVTIGGKQSDFGKLTPGEQLRLRIALVIGLLRIGESEGIGRFPGLLLVDSPNSEEMVEHDAAEILQQLSAICEELPSLQVFVASAKPDLVMDVVDADHLIGNTTLGKVF